MGPLWTPILNPHYGPPLWTPIMDPHFVHPLWTPHYGPPIMDPPLWTPFRNPIMDLFLDPHIRPPCKIIMDILQEVENAMLSL
jgi:hypothetical protein